MKKIFTLLVLISQFSFAQDYITNQKVCIEDSLLLIRAKQSGGYFYGAHIDSAGNFDSQQAGYGDHKIFYSRKGIVDSSIITVGDTLEIELYQPEDKGTIVMLRPSVGSGAYTNDWKSSKFQSSENSNPLYNTGYPAKITYSLTTKSGCSTTIKKTVDESDFDYYRLQFLSQCGRINEIHIDSICDDCQVYYIEGAYTLEDSVLKFDQDRWDDGNAYLYIEYGNKDLYVTDTIELDASRYYFNDYILTKETGCLGNSIDISPRQKGNNFSWSTGEVTQSISPVITRDIQTFIVDYNANIWGHECNLREHVALIPKGCENSIKISGLTYVSNDPDRYDFYVDYWDETLSGVKVNLVNSGEVFYTESSGAFNFFLKPFEVETLVVSVPDGYFKTSNTQDTVIISGGQTEYSFQFGFVDGTNYTHSSFYNSTARPGFTSLAKVRVCNASESNLELDEIKVTVDNKAFFKSEDQEDYIQVVDSQYVSISTPTVNAKTCESFRVNFTTFPNEVFRGQNLCFETVITHSDNSFNDISNETYCSEIRGSYDPNHKEATVGNGIIPDSTEKLTYIVQFQNTGTDTAFKITIVDTLDKNSFDPSSINMLSASHDYTVHIDSNGVATWNFKNILLVDSNTNEPLSHGVFSFEIDLLENLPLSHVITNFVDIYFDYNQPVKTNTATNYYVIPTNATELNTIESILYPNPAVNNFTILIEADANKTMNFQLFSSSGQLVLKSTKSISKGSNNLNFDTHNLSSGTYYLEADGISIKKEIVILK